MFRSNWFENLAKSNFEEIIKPLFSGKRINYLEIGTYEGASLHYMFTNVMTDVESKATIIDPFIFYDNQQKTFLENMKSYKDRINLIVGYSQNELKNLPKNYYDFIYIDGDHTSEGVFNDAILSFLLLKNGGIIIFDDYLWRHDGEHTMTSLDDKTLMHPNNPHNGINQFLSLYKEKIEIIKSNWQMVIKKKE
jgi:predicted O-methyltransferase YrrM